MSDKELEEKLDSILKKVDYIEHNKYNKVLAIIISILIALGVTFTGYGLTYLSALDKKMDNVITNMTDFKLDYTEHKTETQLKIEVLEKQIERE